jgi:hypothetical protein
MRTNPNLRPTEDSCFALEDLISLEVRQCINSATLARFKEGKGRTRGIIFTLSDIDAAAAMAGQIMEKTIFRQPISIKDARAAGLRFSNGLLYPSDVFAMEWDPDEPEDQEMSEKGTQCSCLQSPSSSDTSTTSCSSAITDPPLTVSVAYGESFSSNTLGRPGVPKRGEFGK